MLRRILPRDPYRLAVLGVWLRSFVDLAVLALAFSAVAVWLIAAAPPKRGDRLTPAPARVNVGAMR